MCSQAVTDAHGHSGEAVLSLAHQNRKVVGPREDVLRTCTLNLAASKGNLLIKVKLTVEI